MAVEVLISIAALGFTVLMAAIGLAVRIGSIKASLETKLTHHHEWSVKESIENRDNHQRIYDLATETGNRISRLEGRFDTHERKG